MKGLTHFISGAALATFSSQAVSLAQNEHSLIIVLGGIFGILPDTLDFKFAKFFYQEDYIVSPSKNPDLQEIADTIVRAVNQAGASKKTSSLRLDTIKLGADLWKQYTIQFQEKKVIVKEGPVVNTGKVPLGAFDPEKARSAEAVADYSILHTYGKETYVDIFSGPSFAFNPRGEKIEAEFLPWHRSWSHSLVLGLIFGFIGFLIYGMLSAHPEKWHIARLYGLVIAGGFSIHVLEDQLGFMGSNLYWPLSKERATGLKWMHSGDAWPNFITVWIALIAMVWNLNCYSSEQTFNASFVEYLGYSFFIPLTFLLSIGFVTGKILKTEEAVPELEKLKEIKSENEEESA